MFSMVRVHIIVVDIPNGSQDPDEILARGSITKIREGFKEEDYDLDEGAELEEEYGKWWISVEGEKKYRVKAEDDRLEIYLF